MTTETGIYYRLREQCSCAVDRASFFSECPHSARPGTLTTDHAASSYGQPVIVGEDGRAYGPAEAEIAWLVTRGEIANRQWYITPSGQEWDIDPEIAALQMAAQATGYVVDVPILGPIAKALADAGAPIIEGIEV